MVWRVAMLGWHEIGCVCSDGGTGICAITSSAASVYGGQFAIDSIRYFWSSYHRPSRPEGRASSLDVPLATTPYSGPMVCAVNHGIICVVLLWVR
jgi:hypothetical protein